MIVLSLYILKVHSTGQKISKGGTSSYLYHRCTVDANVFIYNVYILPTT